ncbi:6-bladed beta-propeller [Algoriphagus namhaensis]
MKNLIMVLVFASTKILQIKKNTCIILVSLVLHACQNSPETSDQLIKTVEVNDQAKEMLMSTLVDSIKVIVLDNSELVGSIDEIAWSKDRIIVLDKRKTEKVFVYDRKGKLIKSIDSGEGEPNKFVWPGGLTLSSPENSFFVISDRTKKILEYSLDGEFVKEYDVADLGEIDDMIAIKDGFAFSKKPDSQSGINIIFTDLNFNETSHIKSTDFFDEPLFVSGGATNSFYPTDELGHFFYKELMSNKILEIKDKRVVGIMDIDLPDSYEVDYSVIGRSLPEVLAQSKAKGLIKLDNNQVSFGDFMILSLSNSGRGQLGVLDKENNKAQIVSNVKNDLSVFVDIGAVWGDYNNGSNRLLTSIEAPIMSQLLETVDYSASPYASIFDNLELSKDGNPVLIVYELKKDFKWPFD